MTGVVFCSRFLTATSVTSLPEIEVTWRRSGGLLALTAGAGGLFFLFVEFQSRFPSGRVMNGNKMSSKVNEPRVDGLFKQLRFTNRPRWNRSDRCSDVNTRRHFAS